MKTSIFTMLAGMLVVALMLLVQAPQSYAASATTGVCDETACLLPRRESEVGQLNQAHPLQRLAKIELNLTIGCPHGFHWDGEECVSNRKQDRFECPDGLHWNGDDCVPDREGKKRGGGGCVVGFHWNGDHCVPDRKRRGEGECSVLFGDYCVLDGEGKKKARGCPEGTKFVNGKCRKSEFPPIEGQEGGGGDGFSCSHNDHLENGRCVPCKEGFHVEGDECVAD
ncbi:hypothetical protein EOD23_01675 [Mesorhizobium sp. USDA-HM6]|nr:hypothetical protein EOD23_01675 [Mesorhizobium sp. USDA-HM6]